MYEYIDNPYLWLKREIVKALSYLLEKASTRVPTYNLLFHPTRI